MVLSMRDAEASLGGGWAYRVAKLPSHRPLIADLTFPLNIRPTFQCSLQRAGQPPVSDKLSLSVNRSAFF